MAEPDRAGLGAGAEALAFAHLQRAGLDPLAANVRYRFGEIDLVMLDGEQVVFVEVRYRRGDGFGGAAVSVDRRKRQRLLRAAQAFLAARPELARRSCRFDVVALSGRPQAPALEWIRDAFTLDDG